jgi:hypothetical protein
MKVNYCGGKQQEKMMKNGWRIELAQSYTESPEEIYNRLTDCGYSKVKIYYETTRIRGLHSYFAMVKR